MDFSAVTEFNKFIDQVSKGQIYSNLQKYAEQYLKALTDETGKMKGWRQFIIDSYSNGGIDLTKITEVLKLDNGEFGIARSIYEFFLPLGIIMLIIYLLLDVLNITTSRIREFDIKSFLMVFFKGAIGIMFLKYGYSVMGNLLNVSNAIIEEVVNGTNVLRFTTSTNSGMDAYFALILEKAGKVNFLDGLGLLVSAALLQITQVIPEILVLFQAISRKIEIVYRVGIAPISLPDIYNGISNSKAIIYIKRFAVVLMHGPMMVIIVKVAYFLQSTYVSKLIATNQKLGVGLAIEMALYGFAAAGLISSCKAALNDALGC